MYLEYIVDRCFVAGIGRQSVATLVYTKRRAEGRSIIRRMFVRYRVVSSKLEIKYQGT